MAIETAQVSGTSPIVTGTKTFDSAGFGTPQAAIVTISRANATNNPEVEGCIGIGLTDGVRQNFCAIATGDALGTSTTARHNNTTACCVLLKPDTTVYVVGVFSAWSTNGITLNFTVVDSVAYDISITLIKGCSSLRVDSHALTTTGVNDITALTAKPNFGLITSIGSATLASGAHAILGFGAFHNSSIDVVTQGYTAFSSVSGQTSEVSTTVARNDSAIGQLFNDSQSWKGSIQDVDATGFSVNTGGDSPGSDYIFYIAGDTGDTDGVDVSIEDSPITTGNWTVSSAGFTPQSTILGLSGSSVVNTPQTSNPTTFGLSMFDSAGEHCIALDVNDAATTTDAQSNSSTANAVQLYNGSGGHSLLTEGAFSAFTGSGYTINFPTTVDATTRKWLSISFKSGAAPPSFNSFWIKRNKVITGYTI